MAEEASPRSRAALALLLLVPVPTLGVLAGMHLRPGTPVGQGLYLASKVWFFALPALWLRFVERRPFGFSPARHGGFGAGLLTGILLGGAVVLVAALAGDRLLPAETLLAKLREIGLGTPWRFAAGAAYWILVNSVLEEYAWRWFCLENCRALLPQRPAVVAAALAFTLHHFVALVSLAPVPVAALMSAGVLVGGLAWSALCARYRSIWPAYLSHAIVDLAIFGVAGWIAFGGSPVSGR